MIGRAGGPRPGAPGVLRICEGGRGLQHRHSGQPAQIFAFSGLVPWALMRLRKYDRAPSMISHNGDQIESEKIRSRSVVELRRMF